MELDTYSPVKRGDSHFEELFSCFIESDFHGKKCESHNKHSPMCVFKVLFKVLTSTVSLRKL